MTPTVHTTSRELVLAFHELPPELWLHIFSFAEDPTVVSLLLVSHAVRECTLRSVLPIFPIQLSAENAIHSFHMLLSAHPHLATLVRHLWLRPLSSVMVDLCVLILDSCTSLRSLSCNLLVAQKFLSSPNPWLHTHLTSFTLVRSGNDWHRALVETHNGPAFMHQLTSLGLYQMDWWYNDFSNASLKNLQFLSIDLLGGWWANDIAHAHQILRDKETFPELKGVEMSCRIKAHFWEPSFVEDGLVLLVVPRPNLLGANHIWAETVKGKKLVDQAVSRSKMRG